MRALLAGGERPDALFAASDLMALGVLRVVREVPAETVPPTRLVVRASS